MKVVFDIGSAPDEFPLKNHCVNIEFDAVIQRFVTRPGLPDKICRAKKDSASGSTGPGFVRDASEETRPCYRGRL